MILIQQMSNKKAPIWEEEQSYETENGSPELRVLSSIATHAVCFESPNEFRASSR